MSISSRSGPRGLKNCHVWNINIMYWNGKVDSLKCSTLLEIPIISEKASMKSCGELNFLQKTQWHTCLSPPGVELGYSKCYVLKWNTLKVRKCGFALKTYTFPTPAPKMEKLLRIINTWWTLQNSTITQMQSWYFPFQFNFRRILSHEFSSRPPAPLEIQPPKLAPAPSDQQVGWRAGPVYFDIFFYLLYLSTAVCK